MTRVLLVFVVLTALAAVSSSALALLSWRRRQVPGVLFFSAMMVGATVWCVAYVGELTSHSLLGMTIWGRLAYLGIATVPPSWLLFCLSYAGRLRQRTRGTILAFYLLPLVTLLFAMLGTAVPLVWSSTSIATSDGMRVLATGYGPWFWAHTAYSYACLAGGSVILLVAVMREVRPLTRQGLACVLAVSLPWLLNVLTIFHIVPLGNLDLTPPAIAASGLLLAIGLWRLQLFDVFPGLVRVARDALIMELPDGVLIVDGHGRVLSANRAADELLSGSGQSVVGQPLAALVDEASPACETLSDLEAVERQRLEMIVPGSEAGQRHLEIAISRQGSSRRTDGHVLVMRDISERVATTQALRESGQRLRVLFDQSPVGVMVFDRELVLTECNERFAKMVGAPHDDLIGYQFTCTRDSSLLPLCQAALRGETSAYNGSYTMSPGVEVWLQGELSPLRDQAGEITGGIGVLLDMTESKRAEELIERLAFNDTVTGLPNRTLFRDRLRQVLAGAARSASNPIIALVNLDHFKAVNESIGHASGDRALQAVGERLQADTRDEDTVGRWGGDEFAVLMPGPAGGNDSFAVAQRLAECFAEPWLIDGHELWLTASIGLAVYLIDGADSQALLDNAETAMYAAKKLGGDCQQFFAATMNDRLDDRLELTSALHHALKEREFVVYYQPQVDLGTMRVVGCEALVRWQHPERGLVAPDLFIPHAEDTGLMLPIGEWVLREACAQAATWEVTYGNGIRVAVNLWPGSSSSAVLPRWSPTPWPSRVSAPSARVRDYGDIDHGRPRGGGAHARRAHCHGRERRPRRLWHRLFVADASAPTADRPAQDRPLVRGSLPDNPDDCAIAVAVIDLARNLGLEVIAEGVESWQQVSFLRAKGCSEVQGYLFGKPEPAANFTLVPAADMVSPSSGG